MIPRRRCSFVYLRQGLSPHIYDAAQGVNGMEKIRRMPGFPEISVFGLGTTGFWSGSNTGLSSCIREAVDFGGLNVLDTAEMYGDGRCEKALGQTIRMIDRDQLFLVDKILPENAAEDRFRQSLMESLNRLGTDYLDLYLLHWRGNTDLSFLTEAMESAVREGLIRHWGVSNFDTSDLADLLAEDHGENCFCNQIFYNIYERGCEAELLPFMKEHHILPMSYSSLGSDYHPHPDIHRNSAVMKICRESGISPEALMLRWNTEHGFCALFSTSSMVHLRENLRDIPDSVSDRFRETVDHEFPPPAYACPLVKI